jgi:hypothetical protein
MDNIQNNSNVHCYIPGPLSETFRLDISFLPFPEYEFEICDLVLGLNK